MLCCKKVNYAVARTLHAASLRSALGSAAFGAPPELAIARYRMLINDDIDEGGCHSFINNRCATPLISGADTHTDRQRKTL